MAKIYTKTGDKGTTSLLSGMRVKKSDSRLMVYGQVDHLNSMIGLLINSIKNTTVLSPEVKILSEVQSKLFNLGALLACPHEDREKFKLQKIGDDFISRLEEMIDLHDDKLDKLSNFILPSGSEGACFSHLCRTQARNVERILVDVFEEDEAYPRNSLIFINRLSDFFFNLSRLINKINKVEEIIWKS